MCSKEHSVNNNHYNLPTLLLCFSHLCPQTIQPTNHKPKSKTMKVIAVFGSNKIIILASTTTTTITTTIMHKMLAKEVVIEAWSLFKIKFFFGILSKALVGLADDPQIQKMCLKRKPNRYLDDDLRNARTEFTYSQPTAPIAQ